MNQPDDKEFWSGIGETLRPRLRNAHWAAQRRRILARLAPESSGHWLHWGAAAALAGAAAVWLMLPVIKSRTSGPAQTAPWDVRLTMVQGEVTVFARGSDEGLPAQEGMPLNEGDNVRTGADGRAELALSAEALIALDPGSVITLSNLDPKQTHLGLDLGTLVAKLGWKGPRWRRLDVVTPTAVAAVRGTEFGVTVQQGGDTAVGVFDEGKVAVRTTAALSIEETMLTAHQEVHVAAGPQVETETKDGRNFLRVSELSQLKPYQEKIDRLRQRPEVLRRTWKDIGGPEREQVRAHIREELETRMLGLSPEQRQDLRERLRRPEPSEARGGDEGLRPPRSAQNGGQTADRQARPAERVPQNQEHPIRPETGERRQTIHREEARPNEDLRSRRSSDIRPTPGRDDRARQPGDVAPRPRPDNGPQHIQNRPPGRKSQPPRGKNRPPGSQNPPSGGQNRPPGR